MTDSYNRPDNKSTNPQNGSEQTVSQDPGKSSNVRREPAADTDETVSQEATDNSTDTLPSESVDEPLDSQNDKLNQLLVDSANVQTVGSDPTDAMVTPEESLDQTDEIFEDLDETSGESMETDLVSRVGPETSANAATHDPTDQVDHTIAEDSQRVPIQPQSDSHSVPTGQPPVDLSEMQVPGLHGMSHRSAMDSNDPSEMNNDHWLRGSKLRYVVIGLLIPIIGGTIAWMAGLVQIADIAPSALYHVEDAEELFAILRHYVVGIDEFEPARHDEILIVVTRFHNAESYDELNKIIRTDLKNRVYTIEQMVSLPIRIETSRLVFEEQQVDEARKYGARYGASMVMSGEVRYDPQKNPQVVTNFISTVVAADVLAASLVHSPWRQEGIGPQVDEVSDTLDSQDAKCDSARGLERIVIVDLYSDLEFLTTAAIGFALHYSDNDDSARPVLELAVGQDSERKQVGDGNFQCIASPDSQLHPAYANTYSLLGSLYFLEPEEANLDIAQEYYGCAIDLKVNNVCAYSNQILILQNKENYKEAEEVFKIVEGLEVRDIDQAMLTLNAATGDINAGHFKEAELKLAAVTETLEATGKPSPEYEQLEGYWHAKAGDLYLRQKLYERSEYHYRQASQLFGELGDLQARLAVDLSLAVMLLEQGKMDEAASAFAQTGSPTYLAIERGYALEDEGELDDAREIFISILSASSAIGVPILAKVMAIDFFQRNQTLASDDEVIAMVSAVLDDVYEHPNSNEISDASIASLHAVRGEKYYNKYAKDGEKDYNKEYKEYDEKAEENLQTAIKLGDSAPYLYFYLANIAWADQRLLDASEYCRQYLLRFGEDPVYYELCAAIASDNEDYELAVKMYDKAISTGAERPGNLLGLQGQSLMKLKQYDQAIESFTSSIDLEPLLIQNYFERGSAYLLLGMCENANLDIFRFIGLIPETWVTGVPKTLGFLLQQYEDTYGIERTNAVSSSLRQCIDDNPQQYPTLEGIFAVIEQ